MPGPLKARVIHRLRLTTSNHPADTNPLCIWRTKRRNLWLRPYVYVQYLCKRYFNLASLFTHNPVTCHLDAVFSVSHLFHVRCVVASGGGDGWFSHFFMLGLIIVVFSRLYSLIVHIFTASVIFMRSAV